MSMIPYYDEDERLIAFMSEDWARSYEDRGKGRAIRCRGEIVRMYKVSGPQVVVYANVREAIGALHSASQTTQRIRNDQGIVVSPPKIREHKPRCRP